MTSIFFDPQISDDERRQGLYNGDLFVHSATPNSTALIQHARELIEEAFEGTDPTTAQFDLPVERFAEILADLKPRFIHHPKSKEYVKGVLTDLGADPEKTYFEVPKMRTSTSDDYLTSGISYAFHPHRDTWYSAPMQQLNWWLPIYDVVPENVMAFHTRYFDEAVKNGSADFNYYEWNAKFRGETAKHVKKDTRKQPKPEQEIELDPQVRVVTAPGDVLVFSSAQLHSTVPNNSGRTRFSIDFRTVNLDDLEARRGAPNLDSECTGTTMREYLRVTDLEHVPGEVIEMYDDETSKAEGVDLVFQAKGS